MIKELNDMFFEFIWDSKSNKIASDTLYKPYSNGGLKMINIRVFIKSIRFAWVHKVFDNHNFSPWKLMLQTFINRFGGNCIFYLDKISLTRIAKRIKNPFWSEIMLNWAEMDINSDLEDLTHILSQPLWHNDRLKAGNMNLNRPKLKESGIINVSDIIDHQFGIPRTLRELQDFDDSMNFLNYETIIRSIPEDWKTKILFSAPLNMNHLRRHTIEKFRRSVKPSRFIYELIMENNDVCPSQTKWEQKDWFENNRNWTHIFDMPFLATKETKIRSFQYKLIHRAIYTNTKLVKSKLISGPIRCSFCNIDNETLEHLFYFCPITRSLYLQIMQHMKSKNVWPRNACVNPCDILFGFEKQDENINTVLNYIFLYAKYFIYTAKLKNETVLSITNFLNYIRHKIKLEKLSLSESDFVVKWGGFENL